MAFDILQSSPRCGRASRRSDPPPLDPALARHPCYATAPSPPRSGRIHLPVSPACNIVCRFCDRKFDAKEASPGVARGLVDPARAAELVARARSLCPDLAVVGVAGPGEPLATGHALEALERVHARFPDLVGCLSTNGLRLPENVGRIVRAGVRSLTVTVNAVQPRILAQICAGVVHDGRLLRGEDGARVLIEAQLAGIAIAARRGLTVKVNAVLVPGVNDGHVAEVARAVAGLGARMMNLIPLLPRHELAHVPPPDCDVRARARVAVEEHLPVFRHCKRCRADAVGVPGGEDFGDELYGAEALGGGLAALETFSHG